MSDAEDQLLFVGQKAFIEKDGKILILNDPALGLDFPGGKVQDGEENFDEALSREVREETGLEIEIGEPFTRWRYQLRHGHRNAGKTLCLIGFRCKYKSGEIKLSEEHSSFKWVDKATYQDLNDGSVYFEQLQKYFSGS
ncbi:MAG: NUDIX domain-containing protein [bacterium]|nr:NUDIX domain-containing protein [bacterium]